MTRAAPATDSALHRAQQRRRDRAGKSRDWRRAIGQELLAGASTCARRPPDHPVPCGLSFSRVDVGGCDGIALRGSASMVRAGMAKPLGVLVIIGRT